MKKLFASIVVCLSFVCAANAQMIEEKVPSPFKKSVIKVKDGHNTLKYARFKSDYELDTTGNKVMTNVANALEFYANALTDSILYNASNSRKAEEIFAKRYQDETNDIMALKKIYPRQSERSYDPSSMVWKESLVGFGINLGFVSRVLLGRLTKVASPTREFSIAARLYIQNFYIEPFFNLGYSTARKGSDMQGLTLGGDNLIQDALTYIFNGGRNLTYVPGNNGNSLAISSGFRGGYYFFSNQYLRSSAFIGLGKDSFAYGHANSSPFAGFTLSEGLSLEYKIHRTVDFEDSRYSEPTIQISLYSDQLWAAKRKTFIPTINLGICLNYDFRGIDRR